MRVTSELICSIIDSPLPWLQIFWNNKTISLESKHEILMSFIQQDFKVNVPYLDKEKLISFVRETYQLKHPDHTCKADLINFIKQPQKQIVSADWWERGRTTNENELLSFIQAYDQQAITEENELLSLAILHKNIHEIPQHRYLYVQLQLSVITSIINLTKLQLIAYLQEHDSDFEHPLNEKKEELIQNLAQTSNLVVRAYAIKRNAENKYSLFSQSESDNILQQVMTDIASSQFPYRDRCEAFQLVAAHLSSDRQFIQSHGHWAANTYDSLIKYQESQDSRDFRTLMKQVVPSFLLTVIWMGILTIKILASNFPETRYEDVDSKEYVGLALLLTLFYYQKAWGNYFNREPSHPKPFLPIVFQQNNLNVDEEERHVLG